jgi:alpha/beta superfamily hydrolase
VFRFDFTGLGQSEGDFSDSTFSTDVTDLIEAATYMEQNWQPPCILMVHSSFSIRRWTRQSVLIMQHASTSWRGTPRVLSLLTMPTIFSTMNGIPGTSVT